MRRYWGWCSMHYHFLYWLFVWVDSGLFDSWCGQNISVVVLVGMWVDLWSDLPVCCRAVFMLVISDVNVGLGCVSAFCGLVLSVFLFSFSSADEVLLLAGNVTRVVVLSVLLSLRSRGMKATWFANLTVLKGRLRTQLSFPHFSMTFVLGNSGRKVSGIAYVRFLWFTITSFDNVSSLIDSSLSVSFGATTAFVGHDLLLFYNANVAAYVSLDVLLLAVILSVGCTRKSLICCGSVVWVGWVFQSRLSMDFPCFPGDKKTLCVFVGVPILPSWSELWRSIGAKTWLYVKGRRSGYLLNGLWKSY